MCSIPALLSAESYKDRYDGSHNQDKSLETDIRYKVGFNEEQKVKNLQSIKCGTVDEYLTEKVAVSATNDLGWATFPEQNGGYRVERVMTIDSLTAIYRWRVDLDGIVTPVSDKAIGVTELCDFKSSPPQTSQSQVSASTAAKEEPTTVFYKITFKSGNVLKWSEYYQKGNKYCTQEYGGEACISNNDVVSIDKVEGEKSSSIVTTSEDYIAEEDYEEYEKDQEDISKLKKKQRLYNCLAKAYKEYNEEWNSECFKMGIINDCFLPTESAKLLDKQKREDEINCYRIFNE